MVWHYHFLNWPAFANPAPNSLIAFRKRFREDLARFRSGGDDGPPLVHCCSGGSRSGAFVLIDENLSSAAASGHVDIFGTAKHILTQRKGLFMNPRQLRYGWRCLHLSSGEVWFLVVNCPKHSCTLTFTAVFVHYCYRSADFAVPYV